MDRTFPGKKTTKGNGDHAFSEWLRQTTRLAVITTGSPTSMRHGRPAMRCTTRIIAQGIDAVSVSFLTKVDCQSSFPRNTTVRMHAPCGHRKINSIANSKY